MLNKKDFLLNKNQNNFDFKDFVIKTASYWKWFLFSLVVAFTIAYQVNIRKQKIYEMDATISIKDENNPFFTSNTSLVFNWGGTSDKLQTIVSTLKSRSHNEIVVDKLEYYINYLRKEKYNMVDAYGEIPFYVKIQKNKPQLLNSNIKIKFLSQNTYQISIPFEEASVPTVNYSEDTTSKVAVVKEEFKKEYKVGERINLPFLSWELEINSNPGNYIGQEYYVCFKDFDKTVLTFQDINVDIDAKGSSILRLSLQGTNKARMVKYLNTTVEILKQNQLNLKNQFATNTIAFIDSTLIAMEDQIKVSSNELKKFSKDKNIYEVEFGGSQISELLLEFDIKKDELSRKLNYYNSLSEYLRKSVDFSKLPAPTVAGIEDPNIIGNVSKLIALSIQRSQMQYAVKNDKLFKDFDNQMESVKRVLLENITTARAIVQSEYNAINSRINRSENEIKKLPEDQQELMKIKRRYELSDNLYNNFLSKKSEAYIVRASNISDIYFIDEAKDIGEGLIGPKTSINYILAFFSGILLPLLIIIGILLFNNTIQSTDEIAELTQIPLLGVIGKKIGTSNLAVYEKPKSAISESFRAIRSSLQFIYKKNRVEGAKTLMITSTVSGEGKTFCSINIASIFAISEKKTVIVGLDLRKPKIFDDFNISNDFGVVNYLIGQRTLEEVTQPTHIPFLDAITSGPIPPNPSELIMGESMKAMLDELKQKYDYIILDTPPLGLVSDVLEICDFSDAVLYIVRQNFTKKEMIKLLNNRSQTGELKNVSIVFNCFENKAKYGYGNSYGYGYGDYSNGYHEEEKPQSKVSQFFKNLFKK